MPHAFNRFVVGRILIFLWLLYRRDPLPDSGDRDVPFEVARVLRNEGCEVTELREVLAVRASDAEVFNYAREHGLMLITCNRDDFLSLAAKQSNPGIIIPRSQNSDATNLEVVCESK